MCVFSEGIFYTKNVVIYNCATELVSNKSVTINPIQFLSKDAFELEKNKFLLTKFILCSLFGPDYILGNGTFKQGFKYNTFFERISDYDTHSLLKHEALINLYRSVEYFLSINNISLNESGNKGIILTESGLLPTRRFHGLNMVTYLFSTLARVNGKLVFLIDFSNLPFDVKKSLEFLIKNRRDPSLLLDFADFFEGGDNF